MSEQENTKLPRSVTMSTKMEVPVSLGTMEYIAGVKPEETWAVMLNKDMDSEQFEALRNSHMDMVSDKESTKEFQEKLKSYLEECMRLYQGIMSRNADAVKPYVEGRTFNFVLGMSRTGGTTLYQALSDVYGWPWQKLLLSMTHNFMPNGRFCVDNPASEYDMGWRMPWNFSSLIFELCQFLVYANNEAPDSENIFLKSSALSYATKFLNFLFGEKANYFITVRHPAAIALTSGKEEITREDHMAIMSSWANLYSGIIRECRPIGGVHIVEYGQGLTDAINRANEANKTGRRIEDTAFFEFEEYDREFYESPAAQGLFDYVQGTWQLFDADFPIPDKCI